MRTNEGRKRGHGLRTIGIILALIILAAGIGSVFFFAGADVNVTPKQAATPVDATFTGHISGGPAVAGVLQYDILTLEESRSKSLPSTGSEQVSEPASGTIVVYNNYSDKSQELVKNTRFQTPEGQIFRIRNSISVPGQKIDGGKKVPGSVEVMVYAEEAGDKYNIGLTDFTIPGFKGGPRFEAFYARSKTPMTGGFVGVRKVVSKADEEKARQELQTELRSVLAESAVTKTPEGFLLPLKGVFLSFESPASTPDGDQVTITEKGILHGIIINQSDVAKAIAEKNVPSYDESPVTLKDPKTITIEPLITATSSSPWIEESLEFSIKGTATINWIVDTGKLAADLAGKPEEALNTVLGGYPGVERAKAVLRPIWRKTFPSKAEDIKLILEEPAN